MDAQTFEKKMAILQGITDLCEAGTALMNRDDFHGDGGLVVSDEAATIALSDDEALVSLVASMAGLAASQGLEESEWRRMLAKRAAVYGAVWRHLSETEAELRSVGLWPWTEEYREIMAQYLGEGV